MGHARKVILVAESSDVTGRDKLLREFFENRIELFCAMGKDAREWEDAMDWICIMADVDDGIDHLVLTTSHDNDP